MGGRDFYKILGIQRGASATEIKKAYHQLALRYHPDKNPHNKEEAEKKFKEVSEAYDVLSDDKKKAVYDQFGEAGLQGGVPEGAAGAGAAGPGAQFFGGKGMGGMGGMGGHSFSSDDASRVFAQFFGTSDPFAGDNMFGGGPGLHRMFRSFGGMGGGKHGHGHGAFGMGAGGEESSEEQEPASDVEYTFACTLEEIQSGCVKKFNVTRMMPHGREEAKQFEVKVEPGYKKGTKIRFPSDGGINQGRMADLVFILDEKPHKLYERQGDDLIYRTTLNLRDALLGTTINLPLLDGRTFPVEVKGVTNPGRKLRVNGEGMFGRKSGHRGNIIVELGVKLPAGPLTEDQKRLIAQCNFE